MSPRFTAVMQAPLSDDHALHIVVGVGGERFAFSVSHVEEAIDAPIIEWVPVAPEGMLGQLPHRGRMVGAWDAGWAFRLPRSSAAGAALVLCDGPRRIALVVDDVLEMARIEPGEVQDVPASADLEGVLRGICFANKGRDALVNVVRVGSLAALLASRGTFAEGVSP